MTRKKIGEAVLVTSPNTTKENYSDGSIEDDLLSLFKHKSPDVDGFRQSHPSWATEYHLAPKRQNILNWYDFTKGSSILEIGAGCGALTGLFCEKVGPKGNVTALELMKRRATINAYRNQRHSNLEVVVENLQDYSQNNNKLYDYVVCVGVLEYAGRFIEGDTQFETFIEMLRSQLKPGGTLLLAIENKLGLKYLSGSREDHVQRYMESIEDYPHFDGIRTFGKQELDTLLQTAGFNSKNFYYPIPDYKMPTTVYSDSFLPGIHTSDIPSSLYPTPNPDQPRQQVFREQLAVRSFANNHLFGDVANSFIVEARHKQAPPSANQPVFAHPTSERKARYLISTKIHRDPKTNSLLVKKEPLSIDSHIHLEGMVSNYNLLRDRYKDACVKVAPVIRTLHDGSIEFEYVSASSLETQLIDAFTQKNEESVKVLLNSFEKYILTPLVTQGTSARAETTSSALSLDTSAYDKNSKYIVGFIDVNFDNILLDTSTNIYHLIDYEWSTTNPVPYNFVLTRALYHFFRRHSQIFRGLASSSYPLYDFGNNLLVPTYIVDMFPDVFKKLDDYINVERQFQDHVTGSHDEQHHHEPQLVDYEQVDSIASIYEQRQVPLVLEQHQTQQQQIASLELELFQIRNSKSWRLLAKGRSLRKLLRLHKKS